MELNHCTNFHVPGSKIPEMRGSVACTCVARAQCTTIPKVMHHRIVFVELYQCTKFRVASSKFPESKGAYIYICIARALCTPSRNGIHHRITLTELHQCTKFGVDISKFPRTGGSLSNKLFWSWLAQPAPHSTVTTKAHSLGLYTCDSQVWHQRYPPFGL